MENTQFVRMPKDVMQMFIKCKSFSYKARVFMAICIKTYGWNKKLDWISLSQLEEMTGIAKTHISRTLKELVFDGSIIRNNDKKITRFGINSNNWELPKLVTDGCVQNNEISYQSWSRSLPKLVTTTEANTIERKNSTEPYNGLGSVFSNECMFSGLDLSNKLSSCIKSMTGEKSRSSGVGSLGISNEELKKIEYIKMKHEYNSVN